MDNEQKTPRMSPPWVTYFHEVEALFKNDPDIKISFDERTPELKLLVNGSMKAMALKKLLPEYVNFGHVTLNVMVIPANNADSNLELLRVAFAGNDLLVHTEAVNTPFGVKNFAVFKKDVAQFFNDDLSDIHGVISILYSNLAADVFQPVKDVNFNTESPWPLEVDQ